MQTNSLSYHTNSNSYSNPNPGFSNRITRDDILSGVHPLTLWEYYTEPLRAGNPLRQNLKISNPFLAEKQKTPSFTFWQNDRGEWCYQDYATGERGDIFDLVMLMYGLNFPQALDRMASDFNVQPRNGRVIIPNRRRPSRPAPAPVHVPEAVASPAETARPAEKEFTLLSRPFTSAELAWWAAYGIKQDVLDAYKVQAIHEASAVSSSGKRYHLRSTPDSPIYAYPQEKGAKLYRPLEKEYRFMFLGVRTKGFVFGMAQLPAEAEVVILTGGEKDVLSLANWSIPAICLNSETAGLDDTLLTELRSRFEHIIVLYDNDETGLAQSEKLCQKHRLKQVILPEIPGGGKDISDYFKAKGDPMVIFDLLEESCQLSVDSCQGLTQDTVLNSDFTDSSDEQDWLTKENPRNPKNPGNPSSDTPPAAATGNLPLSDNCQLTTVNYAAKHFAAMAAMGRGLPELRRIFGNYILEGSTVLFPSERGVGKTYFMLQLALSVAAGASEFCGEPLDMVGNTLYINFELGERVLMRRLARLFETRPLAADSPYGAYCLTYNNSLTERMPEIEGQLQQLKPVLVILDNLRAAFSDRDNERNQEMTRTLMELNALRERHRFALVLVHHTKKGHSFRPTDSDMQSGAGALTDLADADFFLRNSRQDVNLRILRRVKSRECEAQDRAKLLRLNTETLWFEMVEDGVNEEDHIYQDRKAGKEEEKAQVMELYAEGFSIRQIAARANVGKATVERWLKEARQ